MSDRLRAVVIGGGVSGLVAAYTLAAARPDVDVLVLEGAAQVGGKLALAEVAGVAVDVGAEAMLVRRPEGLHLLAELGLDGSVLTPTTTAAGVWAGGALHPLPARTLLGIPTDVPAMRDSGLLGPHSLAALTAEPTLEPLSPQIEDVAVGALVRSRLGDEVLDRLVEPLLGGVYAGRADQLSLRATMPGLAAQLGTGGSLIGAAQTVLAAGSAQPAAGPVFASLMGGLARLPRELASHAGFTVRCGTTVRSLRRTPTGFLLECGAVPTTEQIEADAVVVATPAAKAARLLGAIAPGAATELASIESASVAITTLALAGVTLPPGSGLLVGAREGLAVKGVTVTSQKWPLDTGGLTILRASLGRAGEAHLLQREDAELIALVRRDLHTMYGIDADPVDALVTRWGGGLPQYAVGHVDRVRRLRAAVAAVPGLAVCGASYDGVGVPACIGSARLAAAQVASALMQRGE